MAIATFTRRHIVDMLPELLTRRTAGFLPRSEALATELGLSRQQLLTLSAGWGLASGQPDVVRDRYRWRSPYSTARSKNFTATLADWEGLVGAGFAETTATGWRIGPRGMDAVTQLQRSIRDHQRELPVPADLLQRSAPALEGTSGRIPASAERAGIVKRLPHPPADEPPSDMVRSGRAAQELWAFRDDCHIGAWQADGHDGPAFDVLSHLWSSPVSWTAMPGLTSMEALAEKLATKQEPDELERSVSELVRRGEAMRADGSVRITEAGRAARDAIEQETDRRYFAIWDLDEAATSRLGEDLRAIIDAIPKAG